MSKKVYGKTDFPGSAWEADPEEVASQLEKDFPEEKAKCHPNTECITFYFGIGGGVDEFVGDVAKILKAKGWHVATEPCRTEDSAALHMWSDDMDGWYWAPEKGHRR